MVKLKYILLLLIAVMMFSCKGKKKNKDSNDSTPPVELMTRVNINTEFQGQPMEFNEYYISKEGCKIEFTKVNFILSEAKNGSKNLFKSAIYKYEKDKHLLWEGEGNYKDFTSLTGIVGVDASENHEDPSTRASDDPLFILNAGEMHWGWNPGYVFVMIEGRADTTENHTGQNMATFSYHIGNDQLTRNFSFTNLQWNKVNDHLYETTLTLDLYKVLDGTHGTVDIKTERTSHTNPNEIPLSEKIIDNFVDALSN